MGAIWHWLATPLSGGTAAELAGAIYWHARLMTLAWGLILPVGALAARFFKVGWGGDRPRELDPKGWWRAHYWGQHLGFAVMLAGLALILGHGYRSDAAALTHHALGWAVVGLGLVQALSGWLRGDKGGPTAPSQRGDHYDMTPRRVLFEYVHKSLGWLAIVLAIPTIGLGLWLADAPRGFALIIGLWQAVLIVAFMRWQRAGRCLDTYQAIWGAEISHPGNRRAPIGWGIRRLIRPDSI